MIVVDLETVAIMEAFGMGSSVNQAPGTEDLKKFGDNPTGLCFFVSRICFLCLLFSNYVCCSRDVCLV